MSLREVQMLKRYLRNLRAVQGWLDPFSARFIAALGEFQVSSDIEGGSAEIGVHHGKLFLVLQNACPGPALAIDIFGDQHLNIDGSGKGDRERFEANVAKWGDPSRLRIIAGSSLDVTGAQIRDAVGPVALFSVDGGHTEECTLNDLRLAEASLAEGGLVVIDDVFNASWPGVVSGLSRYLAEGGGLAPFAITPNKVYLARPTAGRRYAEFLGQRFGPDHENTAELFGAKVDLYRVAASSPRLVALRLAKRTSLYPALRALKRRLTGSPATSAQALDHPAH